MNLSGPCLPRRDLIAEVNRTVDLTQGLKRLSSSSNRHIRVVERPTHYVLIDVNALNLVHIDLDRVALNEAARVDDAGRFRQRGFAGQDLVTLAAASRLSWRGGLPVQREARREGNVMSAFGTKRTCEPIR